MILKDIVKALVVLTPDYFDEPVDEVIMLASSSPAKTLVYLKYFENADPAKYRYLDKMDYDKKKEQAHALYEKQSKRIRDAGLDVDILQPHFGIAAEEILRVERELGLDIIIIAVPKRSIYRRILNGVHFSEEVSRKAITPILLVEQSTSQRIFVN